MERFSFFFGFYGLVLGLAATELLAGFGAMVRARSAHKIEAQTGLIALLTFLIIVITWIDAWNSLAAITIDLAHLWAPVLLATFYYLAASVIFPKNVKQYDQLAEYYAQRKRFVVTMLLLAELVANYTYLKVWTNTFANKPAVFWLWMVPYNLGILGSLAGLLFVRARRLNILLLILLLLLYTVPYWTHGAIRAAIAAKFHQ